MHRSSRLVFCVTAIVMATAFASSASARALYAYPLEGQTPQQQEADRAACHDWAVAQSGFDPSGQPLSGQAASGAVAGGIAGLIIGGAIGAATGGVGAGLAIGGGSGGLIGGVIGSNEKKRVNAQYDAYLRAGETCMEAKGYQVSR